MATAGSAGDCLPEKGADGGEPEQGPERDRVLLAACRYLDPAEPPAKSGQLCYYL